MVEKDITLEETPEKIPAWAETLIKQNKELTAKVDMFEEMAGKNKIASWKDAQKDNTQKFCYLKEIDGKIVVAWGKLDYSLYNAEAKSAEQEKILINLTYLDGKEEAVNYSQFTKSHGRVKLKILMHGLEESKVELPPEVATKYKLETPIMMIKTIFINP